MSTLGDWPWPRLVVADQLPHPWPRARRPVSRFPRCHEPSSGGSLGGFIPLATPPPPMASVFTWEVKANDRTYNNQFKEKAFLCWQRRKYKVGGLSYLPPHFPPPPPPVLIMSKSPVWC